MSFSFGGQKLFGNILQTIGKTPVVRVNRLAPAHVNMFVKVESQNPGFSVKDRLAVAIVEDAERRGLIKPGDTLIEATSGNTGIAMAMVCAAKGYKFVAVMADSFSIERRKIMKHFGARLVLTPRAEKGTGMINKVNELVDKHGWFWTKQFDAPANPEFHASTTGAEILQDFAGSPLDYFCTGWGTAGTAVGVSRVLRAARPETRLVLAEPEEAPLVSGGQWTPHAIQGWTPDFIGSVFEPSCFDEIKQVNGAESIATSRLLAQQEGIFCGISSGATFKAALKVAELAPEGSTILAMLPDTGERYLTTPLFEGISEDADFD